LRELSTCQECGFPRYPCARLSRSVQVLPDDPEE
jgi:hypothetical protein